MILNFKYDKKNNLITWKFKAQKQQLKLNNPEMVKCYEYLDRIFVVTIENQMSVLYVYSSEGELCDKVTSTKDFFISGMRKGILSPEFIIRGKGKEPTIYTYDVKKKVFTNTGEVLNNRIKSERWQETEPSK